MSTKMLPTSLGRWALIGSGPAARFLRERWMLRRAFPLVAVCDPFGGNTCETDGLTGVADLALLANDPTIDGWIVAMPSHARADIISRGLAAGKRLLVEGRLGDSVDLAGNLPREGSLGVFHLARPDTDFRAARTVLSEGRLGVIHTIRRIDCEYSLPAETPILAPPVNWVETLNRVGPMLLDSLSLLMNERPRLVEAWPSQETGGFQVRLEYPSRARVWVEVHRASLATLQTGWVLEGTRGAYRGGRLTTLAVDGELLEEEVHVSISPETDVLSDLRTLAGSEPECRDSLRRAVQTEELLMAIERSAKRGDKEWLTARN